MYYAFSGSSLGNQRETLCSWSMIPEAFLKHHSTRLSREQSTFSPHFARRNLVGALPHRFCIMFCIWVALSFSSQGINAIFYPRVIHYTFPDCWWYLMVLGFWGCGFQLMGFGTCGVGPSGVWGWGSPYKHRRITLGEKLCGISRSSCPRKWKIPTNLDTNQSSVTEVCD